MTTRILIDNSGDGGAPSYLFEEPCGEVIARDAAEVEEAITALSRATASGLHAAGYFSYELGYVLEPHLLPLLSRERPVPLLQFGLFAKRRALTGAQTDALLRSWGAGPYSLTGPEISMDRDTYRQHFARTQRYIADGDIYQLNLTLKGRFRLSGCPVTFYRELRRRQPVAHGALMQFDGLSLLSLSPELFLSLSSGTALTRPMKGTAARGLTPVQDAALRNWLSRDEKSRAENLMIVDLMRNDLSRIAQTGSVRVETLFNVETYRTLHQMTSDITARLRDDVSLMDLLKALFPPGSITGAPKLRAMEIIHELESGPRGIYTGAIGMLAPDGSARFNVAIRTLTIHEDGRGEIGIGSGIVHDSEADAEYDECLLKMRFMNEPAADFELIETLLHKPGSGYVLLSRHLERLAASAGYFGFPYEEARVRDVLEREAARLGRSDHRVRLLLSPDGSLSISATPVGAGSPEQKLAYVFSPLTMSSDDVFLYHKTTRRQTYDQEHARLSARFGADEVLFVNERGELTEGSRTNIFIERGGKLLTPALECGLLPGTLRADLLASGKAEEAVLYPADLESADAVFLGNSVRGLVPAVPLAQDMVHAAAR
ncbi:MAG: aminodeoxychorismate synthase component I [Methyloligellaceae bacterium]